MDSLEGLEQRLDGIERSVGDLDGLGDSENVYVKLQVLSMEVKRLYRDGMRCSKVFWKLVEVFVATQTEKISEKEQLVLETCLESFEDILGELRRLEMWCSAENLDQVLSCGMLAVGKDQGYAETSKLPTLLGSVSALIVETMGQVYRFLNMISAQNEIWSETELRMRSLERRIRAIEESRVV
ncbi:LADA_0F00562g1_1 [Lachancea dasiensis]|uniref:LADA_0F00562g1_1 n=1 Tax=Lachancea dasiensis TaxID=1072105 RepID=A0A1G4JHN0_9SACH|nr:LADA_0F00562g1_1 [Lachancea dasiensis]